MSELALARHPSAASSLKATALFVSALLSMAALAPVAVAATATLGVRAPAAGWLPGVLLVVAGVAVLAWTHEVFCALGGRTRHTSADAVGAWLLPIANLWVPALVLREAWRATVGRGAAVVWVWMVAWWLAVLTMVLSGLGLELVPAGDAVTHAWLLDSRIAVLPAAVGQTRAAFEAVAVLATLVAGGVLAHIVHTIGGAAPSRLSPP